MILLVGLGNPGEKYAQSRHNLGYRVIDRIIDEGHPNLGEQKVVFLKPRSFMNKSGEEVKKIADYYRITPNNTWVAHDDLDVEFGVVRVRTEGGSAGHKGVQSIIDYLKTEQFARFRIGIGRPTEGVPADKFVLTNFTKEEQAKIDAAVEQCAQLVLQSLRSGVIPATIISNE